MAAKKKVAEEVEKVEEGEIKVLTPKPKKPPAKKAIDVSGDWPQYKDKVDALEKKLAQAGDQLQLLLSELGEIRADHAVVISRLAFVEGVLGATEDAKAQPAELDTVLDATSSTLEETPGDAPVDPEAEARALAQDLEEVSP